MSKTASLKKGRDNGHISDLLRDHGIRGCFFCLVLRVQIAFSGLQDPRALGTVLCLDPVWKPDFHLHELDECEVAISEVSYVDCHCFRCGDNLKESRRLST